MKKKLNQKLINLIEYYNLINANFLLSNTPLKRTPDTENATFPNESKMQKLNRLKKSIHSIKNCELKISVKGSSLGLEFLKKNNL